MAQEYPCGQFRSAVLTGSSPNSMCTLSLLPGRAARDRFPLKSLMGKGWITLETKNSVARNLSLTTSQVLPLKDRVTGEQGAGVAFPQLSYGSELPPVTSVLH